MTLVQASLCVRKDLGSSFYSCGGLVKLVHPSMSVRKDSENSFHHCGGPGNLVHAC